MYVYRDLCQREGSSSVHIRIERSSSFALLIPVYLQGGFFTIRKRYSEFDKLRRNLEQTFPNAGPALPPLPPKSTLKRFQPKFLEKRKLGLSYFLRYVRPNCEISMVSIFTCVSGQLCSVESRILSITCCARLPHCLM